MEPVIKHVLVPVDFSDVSREALRYARSVAERYEAGLSVLTVADDDSSWVVDLSDRVNIKERWREEREKAGIELIGEFCRPLLGETRYEPIVRVGEPIEEILRCCAELRSDLLVIGAHGTKGVVADWLGGVAYALSKKAPCPVMMVRKRQPDSHDS